MIVWSGATFIHIDNLVFFYKLLMYTLSLPLPSMVVLFNYNNGVGQLFVRKWWEDFSSPSHFHNSDENGSASTALAGHWLPWCHPCVRGWTRRRRWCSTLWLSSSASGLWEERLLFPSKPRMGSPPSPSPTPSLVIQRIPSTLLLLLLLALPPGAVGVAAAAVGQPEESVIANGLPVTRLPRLVPHLPPRPQLHLLLPPPSLSTSGGELPRRGGQLFHPLHHHQPLHCKLHLHHLQLHLHYLMILAIVVFYL